MGPRPAVEALAVRVCRTIRDVRQDHQSWISIDRVGHGFGAEGQAAVDAAVAFAAAKGWITIGGTPAHSVLLNQDAP